MMSIRAAAAGVLMATALIATPAIAQPRLVSSSPAPKAVIAKPSRVALTFSEKIAQAGSGIELVMTGMPGMANHGPMKMTGFKTSVAPDGKTLVAAFPRPLPAGTYALRWAAASATTGRAEGNLVFSVR